MSPLTETKDHRFYDFLFNFALSGSPKQSGTSHL